MNKKTADAFARLHTKDKRVRHLVDDPDYEGEPPAPKVPRALAIRKLAAQGVGISQIAQFYGVTYQIAYLAVHTKVFDGLASNGQMKAIRKADREDEQDISAMDPDATDDLGEKTRAQLLKIVSRRVHRGEPGFKRVQAAADELDKRFPGWV